ncbi:SDR family NAD(P)-dependent oxidoreductase [Epibacterium sp. SM1979]|uniref:Phenolphthiocerol/phthiocerol polyketide synthase subunit E n=1 Tax=Tritonibacter litoralis TaxID=2662264 RepID=A0A843YHX2_9RHOB|nr:type I polyketide synthase [Tritonibacter litoralis]MQQ09275.1 SDR family NAD(P)-dependent oxidoreductase [Tritonibacter litoralis]
MSSKESRLTDHTTTHDIAIVGLSVSVPGAHSAQEYWDNLRNGICSIQTLDDAEILAANERPALLSDPNYVRAAAKLDGFDKFDADFFGFSPKEAAILDPQHRKFLEVAWEAMEQAGHVPETSDGPIGVYAGCGMGSYFYFNICSNPGLVDDVGMFLLRHTGNDKDFLTTRVSHVFDLKGPSVNIQTACSTSLVAVHYACEALRKGECAMALAGGVTIELPQGRGYLYKENEILSPDGRCHAFDHRAQGTVFGSGAGAVALRRLEDAIADGDHIWAVIKGSAINNDGADKAGYLAPSVGGQSAAVRQALSAANVAADTVDYVECHGTGTYLGDPIEVSALTEAYRDSTQDVGFCLLGSVKTNIGHLDTAAGIAGLAKTALALKHQEIPPSLGYEAPNPAIDFDTSPFQVAAKRQPWISHKGPRRGAVNALGVGGTNAHAILEEAPERTPSEESDFPFHILCLSGQSKAALDANTAALADHLRANPELELADVAYTLKEGRRGFSKRRVVVAETAAEAAEALTEMNPRRVFTHDHLGDTPEVVFMFPGGGAQYAGMARDLYETEPDFADVMDQGLDHLQKSLDYDIRAIWLPEDGAEAEANAKLQQPSVQLPLIMIVEYALAQLWMSWGVKPAALVGHSMGENTAACLAGVMRFEDCIDLVHLRGRLFDTVPAGGMLSISLPLTEVEAIIGNDIDIASVNAPNLTAVSGPQAALDQLSETLKARDIDHQRIQIDIAAHSRMLDGILSEYGAFLRKLDLSAPSLPIMSNRTGVALTAEQATDPDYWVAQLRNTVRFADCIETLASQQGRVFLEVGPGKALSSLAQMSPTIQAGQVLSSLRHPDQEVMDDAYFFGVIGRLWACGVDADWPQIWGDAKRHRLPLPTYAFQRSRYFIEPGQTSQVQELPHPTRQDDIRDWGYRPVWRPRLADCAWDIETELRDAKTNWLIFEDDAGVAAPAIAALRAAGHFVATVKPGDTYARLAQDQFVLAPEEGRFGYEAVLADLVEDGLAPERIAHFWLVTAAETFRPGSSFFDRNLEMGFYALTALAQTLGAAELDGVHITALTTGAAQYRDEALPYPEKAMIQGPMGVIPREFPGITCASVDIELPRTPGLVDRALGRLAEDITPRVLEELLANPADEVALWRGDKRYGMDWRTLPLDAAEAPAFRPGGTYLITGGFGGIGLTLAAHLMWTYDAKVALVARGALPPRDRWGAYVASHSSANKTARRIQALQSLEAIGHGQVMAIGADVANSGDMIRAKEAIEAKFGPITGILHGAGYINDGPILAKSEDQIAQVFAPKVAGLRVLEQVFGDGELDLIALFSSSSTATCPAGQVDYVAANAYLNAWAKQKNTAPDGPRVVAVNWGVWSDVGMAFDALSARTDGTGPSDREACDLPLFDSQGFDGFGQRFFSTEISSNHWLVDEHRTKDGTALIPGTGYIELAAEALRGVGFDGAFDLEDLYFLRPFVVADGESRELLVRMIAEEQGYEMQILARLETGYALIAQGRLRLEAEPAPDLDLTTVAARCDMHMAPVAGRLQSPQESHLAFGPRWQVLSEAATGDGEGFACLELAISAQSDGCLLHPGLMDLATGWAIQLAKSYRADALWVPVSYDRIRMHRPLTAKIHSHIRLSHPDGPAPDEGFARFDITICDTDGQVLVEISQFQMKRLTGGFQNTTATADFTAEAIGMAVSQSSAPLSSDERRLQHNIAHGIRAKDGGPALERALATGHPHVVVSSLPLPDLISEAGYSSIPQDDQQSFERPQLDTDYVAPRNPVEEKLADMFAALLGVTQVGVEDSFFDLGGHSLIAVRLFAQVKRAFGVEFAISVLFEAPSVAALAEQIIPRTGGSVTEEATDTEKDTQHPSHTHLVQLHPGDGTGRRPFFLVAGMFGNVLNLRHLALMVGKDRPVYGLQAKGLIGSDEPHTRLEDAARACLAEVRTIQPEGPYMLGGFSGGGLTAYEMAQQLQAVGEETAALVLLDTPLPMRPPLTRQDKALIKVHELKTKGAGYLWDWGKARIAWEFEKRRAKPAETGQTPEFNNRKIELAFREAIEVYDLKPWHGAMTLFRPPLDRHWQVSNGNWVSAEREYVFEDNDWTRWAANVEVVEVPGDHDSMVLVPNVSVLAGQVKSVLDQADQRRAAPPHKEAAE